MKMVFELETIICEVENFLFCELCEMRHAETRVKGWDFDHTLHFAL